MEEIKTIKEKTIELIDALKATCQTYGMGGLLRESILRKMENEVF